jgi:hypothetical protein
MKTIYASACIFFGVFEISYLYRIKYLEPSAGVLGLLICVFGFAILFKLEEKNNDKNNKT